MFARIVECQAKVGRSDEVSQRLRKEIVPVLEQQPGFVDFLSLSDKGARNKLVCISLWDSKEDAHQYHQRHYDAIVKMLQPLLETLPLLRTFTVDTSIAHQIDSSTAA